MCNLSKPGSRPPKAKAIEDEMTASEFLQSMMGLIRSGSLASAIPNPALDVMDNMVNLLSVAMTVASGPAGNSGGKGRSRSTQDGGPAEGEGKPGDWTCAYCQTLNYCLKANCHKCGAENTHAERIGMKPGDWVCTGCGDLVFATKSMCRMCSTPRPADAPMAPPRDSRFGMKPGDWSCPNCGDLVFASRSECKMCKTAKPAHLASSDDGRWAADGWGRKSRSSDSGWRSSKPY